MSLSLSVKPKFNLFTLACCELERRWDDFCQITSTDRNGYIEYFHEALLDTYNKSRERENVGVLKDFINRFNPLINMMDREDIKVFFRDFLSELESKVSSWEYQKDIDRLHKVGHKLAKSFFENSRFKKTKERLNSVCNLIVKYTQVDDQLPLIAYYLRYQEDMFSDEYNNVLLVRFDFSYNFGHYKSMPYRFLHEYVSHVFCDDNSKNPMFNHSWMFHATNTFLLKLPERKRRQIGLTQQQRDSFNESLSTRWNEPGFHFAYKFHECFPTRFWPITFMLAAYSSRGDCDDAPTNFINNLRGVAMNFHKNNITRKQAMSLISELESEFLRNFPADENSNDI